MEFENLGAHCQHDGCNQKDFLPFKCDSCGKMLCLSHRSYVSHDCGGDKTKDYTSMDCPICNKSVRFNKGQDPNEAWNDHYLHACTQQAHAKTVVRCFKPGCHTVLGPSNTYTCGKCHQKVCLSHRIPEEHSCVGNVRVEFLNRVQQQMKVGNADKVTKAPRKETNHVSMFMPPGRGNDAHNHKATGAKHAGSGGSLPMPPLPQPAAGTHSHTGTASLSCPFCGLPHEDDASLIGHIAAFHPDDGSAAPSSRAPLPPPPPASASSSNASHREVCPVCQARFPDAIALVRHFEGSHSERSQQTAAANPRPADQTSGKPSDCTVS